MKMALIPCSKTVYSWVCLKFFFVIRNEVYQQKYEFKSRGEIFNLLHKFKRSCTKLDSKYFVMYSKCIFNVRRITPKNYSIFHYEVKIRQNTCSDNVNVANVKHQANHVTCSMKYRKHLKNVNLSMPVVINM
jgi:hypothetical protein